ncbi:MAG: hypothetical protein J6J44_04530 [Lachnospiraceae bacterium]|nr:hypothetical protein [Lachnospiraceae bacterium]
MNELSVNELVVVEGGGIISCLAGGVAFALIGTVVSAPVALAVGDASIVGKTATFAGSIGLYVGAGCPFP